MIRILIFVLSIILVVGALTYFASVDSRITGEAFGYKIDAHAGLVVGGFIASILAAIYLTHFTKNILAIPARIKAREAEARRSRGIAALTRGLEAVAVGDATDAAHHAKVAQRNLDDIALTRLLSAQAAQLGGDGVAAEASFTAMLEAPETEFLGLKGLYLQAMQRGDVGRARDCAEKAFNLRANAAWAFEAVFDLGLERGAWGDTRNAIARARRNKIIDGAEADRALAALYAADAYGSANNGEPDVALVELDHALKLAPSLAPAATLAASLLARNGKTGRAARILETAFEAAPHPALIRHYDRLYKDDPAEKRAGKLRSLAAKHEGSREALLLKAQAACLEGDWKAAIDLLEPALDDAPTPAVLHLMARAAAGAKGEAAGAPWLERAASAPRDQRPGADGDFHFNREGWARLVREYRGNGRLAPPPLEDTAALEYAKEELLLLTAPEPEPVESDPSTAAADQSNAPAPKPEGARHGATADDNSDEHIHNDEEAERIAAAAREVS